MTRPYGSADPYQRGATLPRSFVPLALITLGVVFLLSNFVPDRARGGLVVLGLGAAFLVGRLTTGRYGYAVPAGIFSAIGAYLIVRDVQPAGLASSSGLFFVLLGLGFVLVYAIGMQPTAIWPLLPGAILLGVGILHLGLTSMGPLANLSWIAAYWPAALVLLGAWFLLRESVPVPLRRPIATAGGLALLFYGVIAAAASVAAGGALDRSSSQFADTTTLEAPISAGQTLTVSNASGTTTLRGGSGTSVHVVANRHVGLAGQPPEVSLTPEGNGLTLAATDRGRGGFLQPFGGQGSIDYTIDVPSGVGVNVQSSSGGITISDVNGPVQATSSSGSIHATQLQHLRSAQASSGSISLDGVFTDAASVSTSSGAVSIRLLPGTAIDLDVHTGSGSITPQGGLQLTNGVTRRNQLTGAIATPAPGATLTVQTSSGNVVISQ
jgi:Putative adhesin